MISEYIELVESFKKNQISKLIETIDLKISEALNSPKFNSRIAPYLVKRNKEGVPFTNFSLDPDNISQIKKIINALYHARLAFIDLENVDIRNLNRTLPDLKKLYQKTIHEAYEASFLLTHLDVDIKDMFSEELALLLPIFTKFQTIAQNHSATTKELAEQFKTFPVSYKAGEIAGIAIEQMRPNSGDLDYNFLTQFSAALPGYIDKITQYISQYSSHIIEKESGINKEKITELQNAALKLLNDLENIKGNSLFLSFKVLKYIHIIRNILTLSMSSLEQMGSLNDSSQDVIRDNLAQLKYSVLPTLFGLVDTIEDNAMLKPGTLSIPLMEKVKPLYAWLIYYSSKPVNFMEKGEELLSIEDPRFLSLRLERTYKRIDSANKALFKITKAEEALNEFYDILEDEKYANIPMHKLPKEIKAQLSIHYKLVKPYMIHIDVDFNSMIIRSLQGGESLSSILTKPWRWAKSQLPADHISFVLAKKTTLHNLISKKRATQQFHIDLSMDLISSVQIESNLVLFPYSEPKNIFVIDESTALNSSAGVNSALQFNKDKEHNFLTNPEQLSADQALDLDQWYRNKHNKFMIAKTAYDKFIALLKKQPGCFGEILQLNNLSDDVKAQCRNLYNVFQPYFMNGIAPQYKDKASNFDAYLVYSLSNKEVPAKVHRVNLFAKMDVHFQVYFTKIDLNWNQKSRAYSKLAHDKFKSENEATPLVLDVNSANRVHHVIPHTNYSKFINEFRKALFQVTSMLNKSMNAQLQAQSSGLPFPELEHKYNKVAQYQTMAQGKQVLALKQIFNALYHMEGIVLELEKLTNRQSESKYVYHLLQAYGHINEIIKLTQSLAVDPHFGLIGRELLNRAQSIFAIIQEHIDAYQVGPKDVHPQESVKYNGLWYTLNAFFIIPKHIRSLSNNNYLTNKELDDLHVNAKQSTLRIEKIIASSDSYFKLFLQSPNMYRLYRDLTNKLNEFISTSHETMMGNLDKFKAEVITPMLLEADLWEDQLGLKPGTLSDTLKKVTDEFYKGLLHPLSLHSSTHIALVCDKTPFEQRISSTKTKLTNAKKHQDKLDKNYKDVERLYQLITTHNNLIGGLLPASPITIKLSEDDLVAAYQKALPKLVKLQKVLKVEPSTKPDDLKFDDLFNAGLKKYEPKLTQIHDLITASHHFYLGKKATNDLILETAKEKLSYLTKLSKDQEKADLLFVEQYTLESFNKQLDALCNRHIGLQYTYNEYRKKLNDHLLTFKEQIVNQSKTASDINLMVKVLLKEKVSLFEKDHFAKYYHLETVRVALAQFQNYFIFSNSAIENKKSIFENEQTLQKKSEYINQFIEVVENQSLTIENRLKTIRDSAKNPNFERVIFAHKHADFFSFTYLVQCIVSLLEALHIYTPARKAHYNSLNEAVTNPPKISELGKRFGLFSAAPTAPVVAQPAVQQPATTTEQQTTTTARQQTTTTAEQQTTTTAEQTAEQQTTTTAEQQSKKSKDTLTDEKAKNNRSDMLLFMNQMKKSATRVSPDKRTTNDETPTPQMG
jgi:hypothetical protein